MELQHTRLSVVVCVCVYCAQGGGCDVRDCPYAHVPGLFGDKKRVCSAKCGT